MRMRDIEMDFMYPRAAGYLTQGKVHLEHFRLLCNVSNIYSERILLALELFLVKGHERRVACEQAGISQSCFSVKLRQIQDISRTVIQMYPWYCNVAGKEVSGENISGHA